MSKVTSKLRVRIPKRIARKLDIEPGDEVDWQISGEVIHLIPSGRKELPDRKERLRLFERATIRQRHREEARQNVPATDRGWRREDLYDRGRKL